MLLPLLQILTIAVWLVSVAVCVPGTYRMMFTSPKEGDQGKSLAFFVGLIFILGNLRWLLAPHNIVAWQFIYGASIAAGVYVWVLAWNRRRDGRRG